MSMWSLTVIGLGGGCVRLPGWLLVRACLVLRWPLCVCCGSWALFAIACCFLETRRH
jgi:hypothetical protein